MSVIGDIGSFHLRCVFVETDIFPHRRNLILNPAHRILHCRQQNQAKIGIVDRSEQVLREQQKLLTINAEKITHGIFYTAITRAKTNLKIYWSSESMHDVVKGFATDESKRKSLEIVKTKLGKN